MALNFFSEEIDFQLNNTPKVEKWLSETAQEYDFSFSEMEDLNYIFCSDKYLHKINVEYLDHDTLTDIITFDNSDTPNELAGDIFISIDRVRENAKKFDHHFEDELHRVLIHGLLHLLGFKDKTDQEAQEMRTKENEHLAKREF